MRVCVCVCVCVRRMFFIFLLWNEGWWVGCVCVCLCACIVCVCVCVYAFIVCVCMHSLCVCAWMGEENVLYLVYNSGNCFVNDSQQIMDFMDTRLLLWAISDRTLYWPCSFLCVYVWEFPSYAHLNVTETWTNLTSCCSCFAQVSMEDDQSGVWWKWCHHSMGYTSWADGRNLSYTTLWQFQEHNWIY